MILPTYSNFKKHVTKDTHTFFDLNNSNVEAFEATIKECNFLFLPMRCANIYCDLYTILAKRPWDTIENKLNSTISATFLQRLPLSPHSMLFLYCSYSGLLKNIFLTLRMGHQEIKKHQACSSVPRLFAMIVVRTIH